MAKHIGISFLISLLLVSGVGVGQYDDNTVSSCFKKVKEALPGNWEVIQADRKPSVSVEGWDGYRFLLRIGRKECLNLPQQEMPVADPNAYDDYEYVMKYSHIDLVLFPDWVQFKEGNIADQIAWQELEQEYFTMPVYMGTGDGFHWFIKAPLYWQEYIREKMDLTGGDDRIKVLIDGLYVEDRGGNTRNSAVGLLAGHGDTAIPSLRKTIKNNDSDVSQAAFRVLGYIRTDQSTQLLKAYYDSKQTRELAAYALIHQPYRPEAKNEYIDMLSRRIRIFPALEACVQFNWPEALPKIEKLCDEPKQWSIYYQAYLAKRTLQGNPVPAEILNAHQAIRGHSSSDHIEKAKAILTANPDKEAATVMAIDLIVQFRFKMETKRFESIVAAGQDILEILPKETTKPLVRHLLDSLDEETSRGMEKLKAFYKGD